MAPLYTMVPKGLPGHDETFKAAFGEQPDAAKAKSLLDDAGVKTPVTATLWYSPDHYGEASADMFGEIKRQLEAGGLFKIQLKSAAWEQYKADYAAGAYHAWQLGWFPDFPDTDNYLSPFYATNNFIGDGYGYSNKAVDDLLAKEKSTAEPGGAGGELQGDPGHRRRGRPADPAVAGQHDRRGPRRCDRRRQDVRPALHVQVLVGRRQQG